LDIQDTLGRYISNHHIRNLKILDIMNHRSGLKNHWNGVEPGTSSIKYKSATEVYERGNDDDMIDDMIDEKRKGLFAYSNLGYLLLGVVIELVSNTSYSDFVKNNILIPLKMNHTGTGDTNIILYNRKVRKLSKYEKWERSFTSSGGELKSCIKDLIKFSKFPKLLDEHSLRRLSTIWVCREHDGKIIISHDGGRSQ